MLWGLHFHLFENLETEDLKIKDKVFVRFLLFKTNFCSQE